MTGFRQRIYFSMHTVLVNAGLWMKPYPIPLLSNAPGEETVTAHSLCSCLFNKYDNTDLTKCQYIFPPIHNILWSKRAHVTFCCVLLLFLGTDYFFYLKQDPSYNGFAEHFCNRTTEKVSYQQSNLSARQARFQHFPAFRTTALPAPPGGSGRRTWQS